METDDLGGTPLHDAAEHGQLEVQFHLILEKCTTLGVNESIPTHTLCVNWLLLQ